MYKYRMGDLDAVNGKILCKTLGDGTTLLDADYTLAGILHPVLEPYFKKDTEIPAWVQRQAIKMIEKQAV